MQTHQSKAIGEHEKEKSQQYLHHISQNASYENQLPFILPSPILHTFWCHFGVLVAFWLVTSLVLFFKCHTVILKKMVL
jgi:hypothetical protein